MGLANEYSLQKEQEDSEPFNLENEFLKRYPGVCVQCGYQVCVCPLVPDSTVGRMAKELDIADINDLFAGNFEEFREQSIRIAEQALGRVGGYAGLSASLPFDRGETNRKLVLLCLEIADRLDDPGVAAGLRSTALKVGNTVNKAGSKKQPELLQQLLEPVLRVFDENKPQVAEALGVSQGTATGTIIIGELVTNKYVSGDSISQGSGKQTFGIPYEAVWASVKATMDFTSISRELSAVQARLALLDDTDELRRSRQQIAHAETCATAGDGPKMLTFLAEAGKFARDAAAHVGAGLVLDLIHRLTTG